MQKRNVAPIISIYNHANGMRDITFYDRLNKILLLAIRCDKIEKIKLN